ncbi:MAG: signal recognition particle subunit SRP19/SEC65 family protein [Candidatus Korarchaeota archaeon]
MKRKKGHILWCAYFNSRISRRSGRRVSISKAAKGVSVEDIVNAVKDMGLTAIPESDTKHPAGGGRVIVVGWTGHKHELIKKVAPLIQKYASTREKSKTDEKEKKKKR